MDVVDGTWTSEASPSVHRILPDGCVDVVERDHQLFVVGPMRRARLVRVPTDARGVRFTPGAVRGWLGVSPAELVDQILPLEDFPVHEPRTLQSIVHAARQRDPCPRVAHAVRALRSRPGRSIRVLADELGWSPRHLRRRLTEEVGFGPRRLARVFRLQHLVGLLSAPGMLSDLAYRCGYADQAHMCRDVRDLAGVSPSVLRG